MLSCKQLIDFIPQTAFMHRMSRSRGASGNKIRRPNIFESGMGMHSRIPQNLFRCHSFFGVQQQ